MKEYYLAHVASPEVHHGPYTLDVIWDWINSNQIHPEGWHITDGHEPWVPLQEFSFPSANVMHDPSLSQELPEEDENIFLLWGKAEKPKTKKALQKNIRSLLNQLWAAHRELFITGDLYDELPDDRYDEVKTRSEQIKKEILLHVEEYCAVSGMLDKWIHEMISDPEKGTTGIYKIKLPGSNYLENYHFAEKWLHEMDLHDKGGCYCFKKEPDGKDEEYIYIGQSTHLRNRLKSYYSHKGLWQEATHLKILQPLDYKNETHLKQLERLLLVRYWQTRYNIKKEEPAQKHNPADLSKLDALLHRIQNRINFLFNVPDAVDKKAEQPQVKHKPEHPKSGNDPAVVHFVSKEEAETDKAAQA